MRPGVVLTVGLALTLLAGCERASPFSPGGSVDGDSGGGATGTGATLVLTDLSVIASRLQVGFDTPLWAYEPSFRIVETSGRSGAVIKKVVVSAPFPVTPPDSVSYETGENCWRIQVRVEAGGTLNAFVAPYASGLGYCAPEFGSLPAEPLPSLGLTVTYVDDHGGTGALVASIPVTLR